MFDVKFDTDAAGSFLRSRRALKRGGIYLTTVPSLAILLQLLWASRICRNVAHVTATVAIASTTTNTAETISRLGWRPFPDSNVTQRQPSTAAFPTARVA